MSVVNVSCLNKTPVDNRGKCENSGNVKGSHIVAKIDSHINEFPVKVSHYKAVLVTYFDNDLNVNKLYDIFFGETPIW